MVCITHSRVAAENVVEFKRSWLPVGGSVVVVLYEKVAVLPTPENAPGGAAQVASARRKLTVPPPEAGTMPDAVVVEHGAAAPGRGVDPLDVIVRCRVLGEDLSGRAAGEQRQVGLQVERRLGGRGHGFGGVGGVVDVAQSDVAGVEVEIVLVLGGGRGDPHADLALQDRVRRRVERGDRRQVSVEWLFGGEPGDQAGDL